MSSNATYKLCADTSLFVCFLLKQGFSLRYVILRVQAISMNKEIKMNINTSKSINKNNEQKKYYLLCETTEEGIKQFKTASSESKEGVTISKMRIDGVMVSALKFEVNEDTYLNYKREEWNQENRFKQNNRCIICGKGGKNRHCPSRIPNPEYKGLPGQTKTLAVDCEQCPYGYNHSFRPLKGTIPFSSLELEDSAENSDFFEPASPASVPSDYAYFKLLSGFIEYVKIKYPKYSEYTDLLALLGQEFSVKEASDILDKSPKTLYGWIKKLRPIFNEYNQSII